MQTVTSGNAQMLQVIPMLWWDLKLYIFCAWLYCLSLDFYSTTHGLLSFFFKRVLLPFPLHPLAEDSTEPSGRRNQRQTAKRTYKTTLMLKKKRSAHSIYCVNRALWRGLLLFKLRCDFNKTFWSVKKWSWWWQRLMFSFREPTY